MSCPLRILVNISLSPFHIRGLFYPYKESYHLISTGNVIRVTGMEKCTGPTRLLTPHDDQNLIIDRYGQDWTDAISLKKPLPLILLFFEISYQILHLGRISLQGAHPVVLRIFSLKYIVISMLIGRKHFVLEFVACNQSLAV
jgi:hypothetical protein